MIQKYRFFENHVILSISKYTKSNIEDVLNIYQSDHICMQIEKLKMTKIIGNDMTMASTSS